MNQHICDGSKQNNILVWKSFDGSWWKVGIDSIKNDPRQVKRCPMCGIKL